MTWAPTTTQIATALGHAGDCQPAECCGVIAGGAYRPLINKTTQLDRFIMDMAGFCRIAVEHPIEAIVHSHVGQPPDPSEADRAMCEKLGLPWLIVQCPGEHWTVIEPCGWTAPLVGRQWVWGSQDCLSVIRDGLKHYAGLDIPDFEHDWNWWKDGENLIVRHFREAGLVALPAGTSPKHCDVFGMKTPGSPVVNHLALFLAPDLILHQLAGQLSRRQLYDGQWQRLTALHLRHEALA